MAVTKTVKINGVFAVVDAAQTESPRAVIKDVTTQVSQVANFGPWTIPGNTVNEDICLGGITLAKRVYIETDYAVTLKFNQDTDQGFSFGPGTGYLSSANGITGIFISTGANDTNVTVIVAGD